MIIIAVAFVTSAYFQVDFPTSNDGAYGFVMNSVKTRVPLANSGGSSVSPPPYNPSYMTFGVDPGAPINPTAFYSSTTPFSTSRWWSRLASQKSPTTYTPSMPFTYTGVFNLYRSVSVPSFGISVARPYASSIARIPASPVCGQSFSTQPTSMSMNISDVIPTFFAAPILWSTTLGRPYIIGPEATFTTREINNMSVEMSYTTTAGDASAKIILSQIVPYVVIILSPGSAISLNSYYRDNLGTYDPIILINTTASGPPPINNPSASLVTFMTQVVPPPPEHVLDQPPLGLSQTSIVEFTLRLSPPCTLSQLADYSNIIQGNPSSMTVLTLLPTRYYVQAPKDPTLPTDWLNIDQVVVNAILTPVPVRGLSSFVSSSTRGELTYSSDSSQPLIFLPSLSMLTVGTLNNAVPIPSATSNYWLTQQGPVQVYIASSGSFTVTYPLINPPAFGTFDIYSSFDANSLKRLNTIFYRDLQALYAIDIPNDTFYTSVRKIFTFAQLTYAVFNFTSSLIINPLLPPLRAHLLTAFAQLLQTSRDDIRLGYSPSIFTIATGSQQYGESQNQMFGDNHVGQYGMLLFTYYILVTIQADNSARRYVRDLFQNIMVDLMRDFAQPYNTDQYIPMMRHFDFGVGISWQTSSIVEASSLQVSEILNGYYACWLVSQLFSDFKLRDFYRAILSIELATHQEYRLVPLSPDTTAPTSIYQMITQAENVYNNIMGVNKEAFTASPGFYSQTGSVVYLILGGSIVKHSIINNLPDYKYLVENINPNTYADFTATSFYRPMTPLTVGVVPFTLGITLNSFQTTALIAQNTQFEASGSFTPMVYPTDLPNVFAVDLGTGLPTQILAQEENPSSFMTVQAAYSLSSYAQNYITNYTWAGANLPAGTCAVIPNANLPSGLAPIVQFNKLGVSDSNTIYWIQYIMAVNGNR
jgi:hypothetical protein